MIRTHIGSEPVTIDERKYPNLRFREPVGGKSSPPPKAPSEEEISQMSLPRRTWLEK